MYQPGIQDKFVPGAPPVKAVNNWNKETRSMLLIRDYDKRIRNDIDDDNFFETAKRWAVLAELEYYFVVNNK